MTARIDRPAGRDVSAVWAGGPGRTLGGEGVGPGGEG